VLPVLRASARRVAEELEVGERRSCERGAQVRGVVDLHDDRTRRAGRVELEVEGGQF
jgi:hypothetical protein